MTQIGIDPDSKLLCLPLGAPYAAWLYLVDGTDHADLAGRDFAMTLFRGAAEVASVAGTIALDDDGRSYAAFALTCDVPALAARPGTQWEIAELFDGGAGKVAKVPLLGGVVLVTAAAPPPAGDGDYDPATEIQELRWSPQAQALFVSERGARGPRGLAPVIEIGTVTTGAAGSAAEVSLTLITVDPPTYRLDASFPRGDGGATGATPALTIGTVQTTEPGSNATATLGGTAANPVVSFTFPRGATGATPALTIGTVTTGAPGTGAAASFSGTAAAPVLNIVIPQGGTGNPGAMGPGGTQELFATYAAAAAVAASLTLNQLVLVQADETQAGFSTIYRKTGASTLTLLGNLSGPVADLIDKTALLEAAVFNSLLDEDGFPILLEDLGNIYLEDAF